MLLPRKLRAPMDARDNRKDVLEYSAFIIDSASATIVPLPTELRIRVLVLDVAAEVRTHLDDLSEVVPDAAQVVHDPRAVADDVAQELGIGEARDPPMNPVVEAVQAVELVRFEREIEQARDGHHDDEADDERAEEQHKGHSEDVPIKPPLGVGTFPLAHQLAQPGHLDQ